MTLSLRTSGDGFATLQPSAPEALRAQVHERLTPNLPGYHEAGWIWNGMMHAAAGPDLNVVLQKGETA